MRIYGRQPVLAALRAGVVRELWIAPKARGDSIREVRRLASEQGLEIKSLDMQRPPKEVKEVHQGVVARVITPEPLRDFEIFVEEVLERETPALFLILDGVEDPQNFGAILRTADAAGVDGVFVATRRRAPISAAVVKASTGAAFRVCIVEVPNLHMAARFLKSQGIWIVAATGEGEVNHCDFDWRQAVALLMGAEGRGVSQLLRKVADARVRIPLKGDIGSLNVSVATGIILFECVRQRISG